MTDREVDELERLLASVPAPFEPLDASMLDGFLCGVLLQPRPVLPAQWLAGVTDADARPLPPAFDAQRLHALARRRHSELDAAISNRRWFDPWVFELDDEADASERDDDEAPPPIDAVYPWVAGFALALESFPGLMAMDPQPLLEPLALMYRHLGADDLEDADDLLAVIESLEPPEDLAEAVEDLVRATLLLADVSRPQATRSPGPRGGGPRRRH